MNKSFNEEANREKLGVESRRSFFSKYGKLAIITPVALAALLSPATSAAPKSCRGGGSKKCS